MFKDAIIIFRKEIKNLVKDKRTLFMILLFPLVLMPVIFVTIGFVSERQSKDTAETIYAVRIVNNTDKGFTDVLADYLRYRRPAADQMGEIKVVFPGNYIPGNKASVEIHFDSTSKKSTYAANRIQSSLKEYERGLAERRLKEYGITLEDLETITIQRIDFTVA